MLPCEVPCPGLWWLRSAAPMSSLRLSLPSPVTPWSSSRTPSTGISSSYLLASKYSIPIEIKGVVSSNRTVLHTTFTSLTCALLNGFVLFLLSSSQSWQPTQMGVTNSSHYQHCIVVRRPNIHLCCNLNSIIFSSLKCFHYQVYPGLVCHQQLHQDLLPPGRVCHCPHQGLGGR